MDEYASSRFMFVCVRAATLPMVMVSTETRISTAGQSKVPVSTHGPAPSVDMPWKKNRSMIANPAALGATDRNAVTAVGAPWYTSGHQKWNGTDAVLNPKPAKISSATTRRDRRSASAAPAASTSRISPRYVDHVMPESSDRP